MAFFGSFVLLLLIGVPVAFAFLAISLAGAYLLMGGVPGMVQVLHNLKSSVSTFTLLPVALFVLMGEVMFRSGTASRSLDSVDKWVGRVPGRLGVLAVGGGVVFSVLTGSSVASVALLGSLLAPEMEKRGYQKSMSLGPIIGSGCLAGMIPPSSMAILLAVLADLSVARFLMAIIVPGIVMAVLYTAYIITRSYLQPAVAPQYSVTLPPLKERVVDLVYSVLPILFIVFMVTGVIFLGVATPSEAAATGGVACFVVAALYRKLNWKLLKEIVWGTMRVVGMIFPIFAGAIVFSGILAYSGATRGMVEAALGLPVPSWGIVVIMQLIVMIMGMFMEPLSILMIVLPMFLPILQGLHVDTLWFGVMLLINSELAIISPPFGLGLFAMKGVAPRDTTMQDVYKASIPFCLLDALALGLVFVIPSLALWLPSTMR